MRGIRTLTAGLLGVVLAVSAATGTGASAANAVPGSGRGGGSDRVELVDPDASPRTASLFAFLRATQGRGVLFGHQQSTEYGLTFDPLATDGTSSDVRAAVGDLPAVVGWDASGDGYGSTPGAATREESLERTVRMIQAADRLGTVQTMSAHMDNLVTGGDFGDATGGVVARILPGGDANAALNAYLDRIARIALQAVDDRGEGIPIVFRPFHENAGSWFWWGAAHASSAQYAELYRYTVEYLRDVKGVHNLLYAYSPGGGFASDESAFLQAYPGDDFVDVLGIDSYDGTGGSQQWLDSVVADLGLVARLADARGKIAALTEFGVSGALRANGSNPDLHWFTRLLAAIRADADARRIAYMMTWTNFGADQFFVPVPGGTTGEDHELLADFRAFHDDPATLFAGDLDVDRMRTTKVKTRSHDAAMHVVSPTAGERITEPTTTVRVRISDAKVASAWFALDDGAPQELRYDASTGYYTGVLAVDPAALDDRLAQLRVHVDLRGGRTLDERQRLLLGARPAPAPGVVDDFESYVDAADLRSAYSSVGANSLSLVNDPVGSGRQALAFGYDFALQSYTGINRALGSDWSAFTALSLWYRPDGSGNRLVLQVVADGVAYEAYPSLGGTEASVVSIPFTDFRPAPWDTANADRRLTADDLRQIVQFNVYVNHVDGAPTTGTVLLDDIRAQ